MRRSPVPSSVTEPEHQRFLDELYRRRRTAIADLSSSATLAQVIAKVNAILEADRDSGQQETS
jgi:hypothetical protein